LEFDVDAWCAALLQGPAPKMAILSNPSNPVGCMLDAAAFDRIVQAAPSETLLVIDEAYYEYAVHTPGFPDALARLRQQQRPWIVLRTFSKAWGLAGLRVGYGIASSARVVQMLDRVRTPFNVNMAAQTAALAVWNDSAYMEQCVRDTVAQREWLAGELRQRGYFMAPSAANFLFVHVRRPNAPVAEGLLQRGVIVKPWKEAGYGEYIRVSIGSPADNRLFLDALDAVMQGA
jgi:histidinol-phosphate aminotransferase